MNPALAAALAGEHAAIFAYSLLGVRLDASLAGEARSAESVHRTRRDALIVELTEAGQVPPAARAGYALPFRVTDRATALRLAVHVEDRAAALWLAALPTTTGAQRQRALTALTDCAVRATRWRKAAGLTPPTVPFPGRPG